MSQVKHLEEISESDFERQVLESDVPVVVDFFTPPCAPCSALLPQLEAIADRYPGINMVKVNAWDNQGLCSRFQIRGVPALLFFKGGHQVMRIDGFDSDTTARVEETISALIEE